MARSLPLFVCILFLSMSCSNEVSQWRGPDRTGSFPDRDLLKEWPEEGPDMILMIEGIGSGLSQPIVYKDIIYVTGNKEDTMDVISAYDMNGTLLWDTPYSRAWKGTYPESRGTPTIEKNRIYLVGGMGELVCLHAKDGRIIWTHNPMEEYHGAYMHWGIVESVLLTEKAALYVTGGEETTVVAFDKDTGIPLWKTECTGGAKSYASSSLIKWNGLEIALIQTRNDLIGVDVADGEVLWSYNTIQYHTEKGKGEATNTPLFHKGEIFVTYGNNQPGLMFSLADDGKSISLKWKNEILDTHHGGLVLHEGSIYGSTMQHNTKGRWASVDWESGKTHWENEWNTKGSIIAADDMLYLYEERSGNVALAEPDTDTLKIISTFRVHYGEGPHWAHPYIYKGMLLIRHGDALMVYDIRAGR